jgi:hypothetical protein
MSSEYRVLLYSFFCGKVEARLTGLLLSRSAGREYKVCHAYQVFKVRAATREK